MVPLFGSLMSSIRESYQAHRHWEGYQQFFPERYRCPIPNPPPAEDWWRWRDFDVHLDRIDHPKASLKVILLHGAGGYGRFLSPLAIACAQYGYSVLAPDLPGYGLTTPRSRHIDYGDWIQMTADLVDAELARDSQSIALFGLSMGGMLAYQVAARSGKIRGVIATTLLDVREPEVRKPLTRYEFIGTTGLTLMRRFATMIDSLMLPIGKLSKMERMSNNHEFNELVLKDRLGGANWIPARLLRTLVETEPDLEPEQFAIPLLLAHPAADTWTPLALSEPFFERLRGPKQLVLLESCGHAPLESPGIDQLALAVHDFLAMLEKDPAR